MIFALMEMGFVHLQQARETNGDSSAALPFLKRAKKASGFDFAQNVGFWIRSGEAAMKISDDGADNEDDDAASGTADPAEEGGASAAN